MAGGATLGVYVSAPLCAGAKRELAREGGRAGDLRLRTICLEDAEGEGRLDLATIGANARHATEDSASIAYIGEPDPAATRFSQPILEAAGIPQISDLPGDAAMEKLLAAIRRATHSGASGNLRESVSDELH